MLQKIPTSQLKKPILICIHDILDTCSSDWSKEIAKNLSDYMINRFLNNGYDVCIGTDENELLAQPTDQYTHAVVIASGTSPKLSDRIIYAIEDKCKEDFYIAGHVLDRKEKYFELHHQFYIINLSTHKDLGFPSLGEESEVEHVRIQPISNSEDEYISQELCLGDSNTLYKGTMHGWNILNTALINNKKVIDLGSDIRNNKRYFYYEYDHVFLRESTELFYNQFLFNNIVVPFNSDELRNNIDKDGPIEQYITLGTGINWVENLHLIGFSERTEVFFTDINPLVLQFMQRMVNDWDGKDYVDFYLEQDFLLPNHITYDYDNFIAQARTQWNNFLNKVDNWQEKWNAVKKLKFHFISIDYMSDYNLDWFENDKNTVFNASDMFDHIPGVFQQSMKYRIAAENRFLNKLKEKDSNIFLLWSSRSAGAFIPKTCRSSSGVVSKIDLIDINELIRPYWHKDDWNVLRPLV